MINGKYGVSMKLPVTRLQYVKQMPNFEQWYESQLSTAADDPATAQQEDVTFDDVQGAESYDDVLKRLQLENSENAAKRLKCADDDADDDQGDSHDAE